MAIYKIAQIEFNKPLGFFVKTDSDSDFKSPIDALALTVQGRLGRSNTLRPSSPHAPISVKALNTEEQNKFGIVQIVTSQNADYMGYSKTELFNIHKFNVCFEFRDKRHLHLFKLIGCDNFINEYHENMPTHTGTSHALAMDTQAIKSISLLDGVEVVVDGEEKPY